MSEHYTIFLRTLKEKKCKKVNYENKILPKTIVFPAKNKSAYQFPGKTRKSILKVFMKVNFSAFQPKIKTSSQTRHFFNSLKRCRK